MFLTDEEINSRLNSPDNLSNSLVIHEIDKGGRIGAEVPIEVKKIAIILDDAGMPQKEIAREFGLSIPQVSNYANGRTSYAPNEELRKVVDEVKGKRKNVEGKAIDLLMSSMGILKEHLEDPDRTFKTKDIASIAKDLVSVADKIRPSDERLEAQSQVHLHLYRPHMKDVSDYEIIDVAAKP